MRIFAILAALAVAGSPVVGRADVAYQTGSRVCASASELKAPPPPGAACANFRSAHSALIAYARDAIGSCQQADRRVGAGRESQQRGCAATPGSDGCGQAMVAAEADYAEVERALQSVKSRNEKPVLEAFPGQGQRIASGCLPVLDTYQQFAYSISGAVNDAVRAVQSERSSVRTRVAAMVKNRSAVPAATVAASVPAPVGGGLAAGAGTALGGGAGASGASRAPGAGVSSGARWGR